MSAYSREMDEKIENYSKYLETVSPTARPNIQFMIHNATLMKRKLTATLAELDVLIAEQNLKAAFEHLKTFKNDHNKGAEYKKFTSPIPESGKTKTQKEPKKKVISSADTLKNNTSSQTTGITNKENAKPAIYNSKRNKTSQDSQKVQKSHTPLPDQGTKRQRSDSNRSISRSEKKQKTTHATENNPNDSHTCTLFRTNMSPFKKSSQYSTQGVQTCNSWLKHVKKTGDTLKRTDSPRVQNVTNRMLADDERTVMIEDLSAKAPNTHKDDINVSKALRQIMSPRVDAVGTKEKVTEDLSQSPASATIQLLFEDEPKKVYKKKLHKVDVKSESLEIGDDVLLL